MQFTLYNASYREKPQNCNYPNKILVTDGATLASALQYDYVAAEYLNSYRNVGNFVKSDCLMMDIDNDYSDNPEDWKTPEHVRSAFPDVAFAVHYSRNQMLSTRDASSSARKIRKLSFSLAIAILRRFSLNMTQHSHKLPYRLRHLQHLWNFRHLPQIPSTHTTSFRMLFLKAHAILPCSLTQKRFLQDSDCAMRQKYYSSKNLNIVCHH
ncbi:MAG: hypothetical protein IJG36_04335 [Synergistaceae bacterium]|nr:hypothetical protein [Synergistaceae bacterium]MBQ3757850.1 hypothetical protein [Synergistaceae bacterium]MBR0184812.1 hypothetical protein [Synergistaceae bacterium]